jgi:hypothetical protein
MVVRHHNSKPLGQHLSPPLEELRLQLQHPRMVAAASTLRRPLVVVLAAAASTRHPNSQRQVDSGAVALEGPRIPLFQAQEWIREVAVSVLVLVEPPRRLVEEDESSRLAVLAAEALLDKPKLVQHGVTSWYTVIEIKFSASDWYKLF